MIRLLLSKPCEPSREYFPHFICVRIKANNSQSRKTNVPRRDKNLIFRSVTSGTFVSPDTIGISIQSQSMCSVYCPTVDRIYCGFIIHTMNKQLIIQATPFIVNEQIRAILVESERSNQRPSFAKNTSHLRDWPIVTLFSPITHFDGSNPDIPRYYSR